MNTRLAHAFLGMAVAATAALAAPQTPVQQNPPPAAAPAQQPAPPSAGAEPAQQSGAPEAQNPKEQGAPLSRLGLSEDQKKQIHDIHKQTDQQVEEVRNNTSLTEQQQRQQIRQLRRGANQQVESVLTPEQREKYDAWRRAQRQHRRRPQPPSA